MISRVRLDPVERNSSYARRTLLHLTTSVLLGSSWMERSHPRIVDVHYRCFVFLERGPYRQAWVGPPSRAAVAPKHVPLRTRGQFPVQAGHSASSQGRRETQETVGTPRQNVLFSFDRKQVVWSGQPSSPPRGRHHCLFHPSSLFHTWCTCICCCF